jgi:uncharacterized MAPEG superfamily protein
MTLVMQLLVWSVVLLIVYIGFQGGLAAPIRGLRYNAGPRDDGQAALGKYPGRAQRALDNFKETYPAFVALALALSFTSRATGIGALGAELWFAGRVAYLPLYLFGVPWLRSLAYGVTLAGLVMMFIRLL